MYLFGPKDGYHIRYQQLDQIGDSKMWHTLGWWQRVAVTIFGILLFVPKEIGVAILNPAVLLPWWAGVPVTASLCLILGYWVFNLSINNINGWGKKYLGKGKTSGDLYVYSAFVLGALTVMLTMIGIAVKLNLITT